MGDSVAQQKRVSQAEMDKLTSLCKRRGFIFQGSESYGGIGSTWDYGPLGLELKRNIKSAWWKSLIQERDDVVGIDSAILMHPRVWEASGHTEGFTDPLVECRSCNMRFRHDQIVGEPTESSSTSTSSCPNCGGNLTEPRQYNLMFKTFLGPLEDSASQVWLRPETAQGIFTNFQNVLMSTRLKLSLIHI